MNYITIFFASIFVLLQLLRVIKLLFNPKILNSKYFDVPVTKYYLIGYCLSLILVGVLIILSRLNLI
jgi:hypothetical protein